jgi:hypothetical protein
MWQRSFNVLTSAPVASVWKLFADVEGWVRWNDGIEAISMNGPFANGTEFTMKPPGQPAMTSRLVNVIEHVRFEDETLVDDVRTRITYTAEVSGPGAEDIGVAVTDDFPAVLKSLASLAEREGTR